MKEFLQYYKHTQTPTTQTICNAKCKVNHVKYYIEYFLGGV